MGTVDQVTFKLMIIKLHLKHLKFSEKISKNFTKFNSNLQKNDYTDIAGNEEKSTSSLLKMSPATL